MKTRYKLLPIYSLFSQINANVIISSGYSNGHVLSNWEDLEFKGVIHKPYTIEKLKSALYSFFKNNK